MRSSWVSATSPSTWLALGQDAEQLDETDMADEVLDSLERKRVTDVHVLGRRGPAYTAFTTKELRELGQLPDLDLMVDPLDLELDPSSQAVVGRNKVAARNLAVLQDWAARPRSGVPTDQLHFWTRPTDHWEGPGFRGGGGTDGVDADGFVVGSGGPGCSLRSWWSVRSATGASPCWVSRSTRGRDGCHMPRGE